MFVINTVMKILLATNGTELNMQAVDLACYMANATHSTLTGIFLEETERLQGVAGESEKQACSKSIVRFKDACVVRETPCKVHRDRGVPFDELLVESRFADLLVVEAGMSFDINERNTPSSFVEKVLANAECPVIVAPSESTVINEVCFTYDGSPSSVYAMKQFTYLFPEWRSKKLSLLEVKSEGKLLTERFRVMEWLKEHYDNIDHNVVDGDDKVRLLELIMVKENCLTIMGAFARGGMFNFFKSGHGEKLLKVLSKPLFIAHRNNN
jgi:nucleotide-binding universal stress UspA family protein